MVRAVCNVRGTVYTDNGNGRAEGGESPEAELHNYEEERLKLEYKKELSMKRNETQDMTFEEFAVFHSERIARWKAMCEIRAN